MNFFIGAFGPPCTVSIDFADAETRKQASVKKENGQTVLVPLFLGQESVVGEVRIDPVPGKKVEHTGVKIELLGQIGKSFVIEQAFSFILSLFVSAAAVIMLQF
jgi:vacuolar protein sorting-associated protein 26